MERLCLQHEQSKNVLVETPNTSKVFGFGAMHWSVIAKKKTRACYSFEQEMHGTAMCTCPSTAK